MREAERGAEPGSGPDQATASSGLLGLLGVAAVALDEDGRIALWSPGAEDLFGCTAEEALGRRADGLVLPAGRREQAAEIFEQIRAADSWAGVFPVRHKSGSTREVEFRSMRLRDRYGNDLALGPAVDRAVARGAETDLALSEYLVGQAPVGLALFDTELRCLRTNRAMERINGMPAHTYVGRRLGAVPGLDVQAIETAMRQVLASGEPLVDVQGTGRTPADPDHEHAWSVSYYRLQEPGGRVLGVANRVVDIADRHRAAAEARERLAVIADAGIRIGTALDLRRTARELAEVAVPRLADLAAVDVLESVLGSVPDEETGAAAFRALAVTTTADASGTARGAAPVGEPAGYGPGRLITRCVREARPILVPRTDETWIHRIAGDGEAAEALRRAGFHSCLAVPLTARGRVLGALSLYRTAHPHAFGEQDLALARELAGRAAIGIDNARLYARERDIALTLQRSLLPSPPPAQPGMDIAFRYRPAAAAAEVGGDWFDVLPLKGGRIGLVIGDVMGSGVRAAAVMGQLRTRSAPSPPWIFLRYPS